MAYGGLGTTATPTTTSGYKGLSAPVTPTQPDSSLSGLGYVAAPVVSAVKGAVQGYQGVPSTPKNGSFVGSGFNDALHSTIDAFSNAIKQGSQNLSTQVDVMQKQIAQHGTLGLEGDVALGKTIVGSIGTVFGAALSPLQGLATVPGVGHAVDFVNKLFGAIGEGSGQGAVQVLNETPLSQEHKDILSPLVHDAASLAGQIAAGKVTDVGLSALKDKVTSIADTLHSQLQAAKETTAAGTPGQLPKTLTVSGESAATPIEPSNKYTSTEELPTIQMGPKPKDTLPVAAESPANVPTTQTVPNVENVAPELQSLAEEAKKHKSAEEFVKAQVDAGKIAYHGTQAKEIRGVPNKTKGSMGEAFYLTNDASRAESFGKDGKVPVKDTGALFRRPNVHSTSHTYAFDLSALKIKTFNNDADFFANVQDPDISAWLRLQGYDGLHIKSTGNYAIFNTAKLKLVGKKSDLTDLYNKVTKETPVIQKDTTKVVSLTEKPPKEIVPKKTGQVTKAASDINATVVRQGYEALSPEVQSKYTPESYKEELVKSKDLVNTDYEDAVARVAGEKPLGKYEGQILYNEVERIATENGDYETQLKLASSKLGKGLSEAAQTMGAHGFNDNPNSPVDAIRRIQETRKSNIKPVDIAREVTAIKTETAKNIKVTAPKWDSFITSITCGY